HRQRAERLSWQYQGHHGSAWYCPQDLIRQNEEARVGQGPVQGIIRHGCVMPCLSAPAVYFLNQGAIFFFRALVSGLGRLGRVRSNQGSIFRFTPFSDSGTTASIRGGPGWAWA